MLSRKSIFIITLATLSLVALLITGRRLGGWAGLDSIYYRPQRQSYRPPPPYGIPPDVDAPTWPPPPPPLPTPGFLEADMPPRPSHDPLCANFPDTSGILLVMKTGASEAYDKVPTQLMTMLKCVPDFLIFSDMDQHIAGYHIHDSLETVLATVKNGNSDFDLYRRQKACEVDQVNCNKLGNPSSEGWNLDKYKNVHVFEKAYAMRPDYDWYVFVDADTYVHWPNLVQWLGGLNPLKKWYLGSGSMLNDFMFAHGGSGYVFSQGAAAAFAGRNPGIANKYDLRAKKECCGDYLLALAVHETTKLSVQSVWPTINGEKPYTLPFGPSHWCHPIVTMHHMNSEETNAFWEFEQRRNSALALDPGAQPKALLLKDVYAEFLAPKLRAAREDWDNVSDDRYYLDKNDTSHKWEDWQINRMKKAAEYNEHETHAHESFEACGEACKSLDPSECFQWRYKDGVCGFSRAFKLGGPVKPEGGDENKRSKSGWDVVKIRKWIEDQGECKKVLWPEVKI